MVGALTGFLQLRPIEKPVMMVFSIEPETPRLKTAPTRLASKLKGAPRQGDVRPLGRRPLDRAVLFELLGGGRVELESARIELRGLSP